MSHDGRGQHSRAWPHNHKLLLLVLLLLGVPKVLGRTVIIGTRGREKRIIADLGEKPAPVLEGREGNGESRLNITFTAMYFQVNLQRETMGC